MTDFPYPVGSDLPSRLARRITEIPSVGGDCLVRYGKREHIIEAYRLGRLRLGPASGYADPSLDASRQDDELGLALDVDTTFLRLFGPGAKKVGKRLSIKHRFDPDFYVLCTSACLRARLFLDFKSDACLVIRKPDEFRDRFEDAVRKALPRYRMDAKRVEYYDPLNVSPVEVKPAFWKHFRFAYQEEVRFVAVPSERGARLEPVFVSLGSLEGIAEVHEVG